MQIFINYILKNRLDENESEAKSAMSAINIIVKIVLWSVGILLILSNLGINVTSLLAGLGIGGVAVALAIQNILSDLFSSFAIHFDKPFVIGDFIVVGDKMGTVKKIGIKTTRIQALQGEEIVISNQELTSSQIQNFKKMQERRVVFTFGVTYGTSNEKLKSIPEIIKKIINELSEVRLDRVHFKEFGDSALLFEIAFYVDTGDYNKYMDIRQEINLKINKQFSENMIEMAYPTQTLFIKK